MKQMLFLSCLALLLTGCTTNQVSQEADAFVDRLGFVGDKPLFEREKSDFDNLEIMTKWNEQAKDVTWYSDGFDIEKDAEGNMTRSRSASLAFDKDNRLVEARVWIWDQAECDRLLLSFLTMQGREDDFKKTIPDLLKAKDYTIKYVPHCSPQENIGAEVTITKNTRG